jgi:formylmethanofuran dehydrogenase subunit B
MLAELPVTCPFCSLLCTDVRFIVDRGRLTDFTPECALGRAGFDRSLSGAVQRRKNLSTASIENTRTWLSQAHQPLLVISNSVDCEAASAAVMLAKKISAILTREDDNIQSMFGASIQAAGIIAGTLGNLPGLDLVLLCGVDPEHSCPRFPEFLFKSSEKVIQTFNPIDPLTAVRWLRLTKASQDKTLPEDLAVIAGRIAEAQSGIVVFDSNWLMLGQPFITEILYWVGDLNRSGRWYALYLPAGSNSTGVTQTLLSETGFAGNLRFKPAGFDYSPHLWCVDQLIGTSMVDLCLFVGDPNISSEKIMAKHAGVRTILISPDSPKWKADTWLASAQTGIDAKGTFLRFDGLPITLNQVQQAKDQCIAQILEQLAQEQS